MLSKNWTSKSKFALTIRKDPRQGSVSMAAASGLSEDVAPGVYLETVCDRGQTKIGRNRISVPFHKRRTYFENSVAVQTNHLGLLGLVVVIGDIKFQIFADVDFPQEAALGHDGKRAINGCSGDGFIDRSSAVEQILGGIVGVFAESGVKDRHPLSRDTQTAVGKEGLELLPTGFDAHESNVGLRPNPVNLEDGRSGCRIGDRGVRWCKERLVMGL